MFSVLGIGNIKVEGDYRLVFYQNIKPGDKEYETINSGSPNFMYRKINLFIANIV